MNNELQLNFSLFLLHRHRDYLKFRNGKFCSLKRVSELHNRKIPVHYTRARFAERFFLDLIIIFTV